MSVIQHQHFMSLALRLAEQGRFAVSPNPMVGCLVVKNNQIIGSGYHQKYGEPHAEINALISAGGNAKNATVYITLEPCCFQGKTPPCTSALIAAGIREVYIACLDPNPLVCGKGIQLLLEAGIKVNVGISETEAKNLNEIFFHYITKSFPFVICKWAMSLDGKTIVNSSDSRQISCSSSQQHMHNLRKEVDAILIGANTAIIDNPQLTIRNIDNEEKKQPFRIILAGKKRLPSNLALLNDLHAEKTIIVTTHKNKKMFQKTNKKVGLLIIDEDEQQLISLHHLLTELGRKKIASILVEGGRTVHESFFKENLVNRVHAYLSPTIISTLPQKKRANQFNFSILEDDYHFTAEMKGDNHV